MEDTLSKLWHSTPEGLKRLNASWCVIQKEPALRFETENSALLAMPWRGRSGWYRWENRPEIIWSTPNDDNGNQPLLLTLDVGMAAWLCSIGASKVAAAHGFMPEINFDPETTLLVGPDQLRLRRAAKQLGLRLAIARRPRDTLEEILRRAHEQNPFVEFIHENWKIGRDPSGRTWTAQGWHAVPMESRSFADSVATAYYETTGEVIPGNNLNDAIRILRGQAQTMEPKTLQLRVGSDHKNCYYDLGNACIRIDHEGWSICETEAQATFWKSQGELPTPNHQPGSLNKLMELLRIRQPELVVPWLVSAVLPDIERPIMLIQGPQGACKTTAARFLAKLLDNGTVYAPPERVDDWFAMLHNAYVIVIDNIDRMPNWLATAMCCCVSGARFARRKLYSNDELCTAHSRNPIIITSIDPAISRGDLAERIVSVDMERPECVLPLHKIESEFSTLWPGALGELFTMASQFMAYRKEGNGGESGLRMADYRQIVEALSGSSCVAKYAECVGQQLAEVATSDDFIDTVMRLAADGEGWRGTARELLAAAMHLRGGGDGWPKNPRDVAVLLKLNSVGMLEGGIQVRFVRVRGERIIHLSRKE